MTQSYFLIFTYFLIFILSAVFITPVYADANHKGNKISESKKSKMSRWYNKPMVIKGNKIYLQHCVECHKANASGVSDWRKVDDTGNYPAPPLNGTAHSWHHDLNVLRKTVREGGVELGGTMPGFAEKLSNKEIDYVIAWVQSQWSDRIYEEWLGLN